MLMTSPVRLKFTANVRMNVYLSPNGPGVDEALYKISKNKPWLTFSIRSTKVNN